MRPVVLALALLPSLALAADEDLRLAGCDGYLLDARLSVPDGPVEQVVILVHGSGPLDLDMDLSAASHDKQENLVFRDVAAALVAEQQAVLRYHKRTYQYRQDGLAADSEQVASFNEAPLQQLIGDVEAMVGHARDRFPEARIVLLGVSQGTYLVLQAAHAGAEVDGLVLIGFYLTGIDTLVYEQTVYRPLGLFDGMDADADGHLDLEELDDGSVVGIQLRMQLPQLDLDGDERYSRHEFMAANMVNIVARDLISPEYRAHEASLPRPADILAAMELPVLFCQGRWDNQTPVYHAQAVEIANRLLWHRENLEFRYYEERGHVLDPRDEFGDIEFRPMDAGILAEVAGDVRGLCE